MPSLSAKAICGAVARAARRQAPRAEKLALRKNGAMPSLSAKAIAEPRPERPARS